MLHLVEDEKTFLPDGGGHGDDMLQFNNRGFEKKNLERRPFMFTEDQDLEISRIVLNLFGNQQRYFDYHTNIMHAILRRTDVCDGNKIR